MPKSNIYAVDFDGTLCENKWPEIGEPNLPLIDFLIARRATGDKLILYTMREGEKLMEAVAWCENHGLSFDALNDNLPEMKAFYGNNPRKIFANYYIDDHNASVDYRNNTTLNVDVWPNLLPEIEYELYSVRREYYDSNQKTIYDSLYKKFGNPHNRTFHYKKLVFDRAEIKRQHHIRHYTYDKQLSVIMNAYYHPSTKTWSLLVTLTPNDYAITANILTGLLNELGIDLKRPLEFHEEDITYTFKQVLPERPLIDYYNEEDIKGTYYENHVDCSITQHEAFLSLDPAKIRKEEGESRMANLSDKKVINIAHRQIAKSDFSCTSRKLDSIWYLHNQGLYMET